MCDIRIKYFKLGGETIILIIYLFQNKTFKCILSKYFKILKKIFYCIICRYIIIYFIVGKVLKLTHSRGHRRYKNANTNTYYTHLIIYNNKNRLAYISQSCSQRVVRYL